jgi:hypothetical protein
MAGSVGTVYRLIPDLGLCIRISESEKKGKKKEEDKKAKERKRRNLNYVRISQTSPPSSEMSAPTQKRNHS